MKRLILSAIVAASLTASLASVALAVGPDVTNGSFETGTTPPVPPGFIQVNAVDGTTIASWTVSAGTVDYVGSYWQAADGTRSIDLNGIGPGAVQQAIATEVGKTYKVTFAMSGNPEGGTGTKTMTADVGAAAIPFDYSVGALNTRTDMKWASRSFTFVAAASITTLRFTSTFTTANLLQYGPAIDNVRVELVSANAGSVKAFDACKKGGWRQLRDDKTKAFRNQGDCVSWFATKGRNGAAGAR